MAKIKAPYLGDQIESLGDFIAAQRRSAELSLRQLALQTGVSNPYLSQIERGLRRPSAEVLQQLSKALRVSAETLYVRAGILDPREHAATTVEMAVLADQAISERQKRVLIDVYTSFVKENEARDDGTPEGGMSDNPDEPESAVSQTATTPQSTPVKKPASAGPATKKATSKTSAAKTGAAETGAAETGAAETGAAETGAAETGAAKTGAAKTGAAKTGAAKTGAAKTGAAKTGAAKTGAAKTGAAKTGAAKTGSASSRTTDSGRPSD